MALAIGLLKSAGAEAVSIEVGPFLRAGEWLYGGPLVAERAASVGDHLHDGDTALDPSVASIIKSGMSWSAVDAYLTEYRLADLRRSFVATCRDLDAIVLPAIGRTVTLAEVAAEPIVANTALGTFTTFTNLLDACALVVPLGVTGAPSHRRGRAVQLVAPAWGDRVIAALGATLGDGAGATLGATSHRPAPALPTARAASGCTLVVVGAHLRGQPLNHQLTDRAARFLGSTTTAPCYRLHALATSPPKPGLVRIDADDDVGGAAIEVELWALGERELGSFLQEVPAPLCIGTVELADGTWHKGFLVEPWALAGAPDVTGFGGWRAYLAATPRPR